jgi:acyl-CoA synthetase (AMP-forming)/AMP-acid ligase II
MRFAIERFGSMTELRSGRVWSAHDLAEAVRVRAAALAAHGIARGDRVIINERAGGSFLADLFAVWQRGACAVCVAATMTEAEIANVAAFLEAKLVVVDDDRALQALDVPCVSLASAPSDSDVSSSDPASSMDDSALMLLTSGTTGTPKGVVHSFRSLLARLAINRQVIGDEALDRTLCLLPLHFGHGLIGNCLTPLVAGHDVVIASDGGPGLMGTLNRVIDDHRITFMSSVPTQWRLVLQLARRTPARPLRRVHVGSAPLSTRLWRQIIDWSGTTDVVNAYGLTETANWIAGASAQTFEPDEGLVGRVWGGAAAVLQDDRLAPSGEGEIVIQTQTVMKGYYGRADLDARTFWNGWLRTGDQGHVDADGTIRILRRLGLEINRGGLKVHPEEIEQLLERHPQIHEACAFAIPDDVLGQRVGAAVVLQPGIAEDVEALRAWTAARLAADRLPDQWFVIDRIPRTDRGKLDRSIVSRHCLSLASTAASRSAH